MRQAYGLEKEEGDNYRVSVSMTVHVPRDFITLQAGRPLHNLEKVVHFGIKYAASF
jgi:hypothetical protein